MSFAISDEREQFRGMLRQFLADRSPETAVREQMETEAGFDRTVWRAMAEQLGLQGLTIPSEYGGQGFGHADRSVVLDEMGRALLCAPYFSTAVLSVDCLLLASDDDAKAALLPGIASGESVVTLAFSEANGSWDETGIEAIATRAGAEWKISGSKTYVLDGHTADVVIVAARTDAGVSLFRVAGDAPGLARKRLTTVDLTRRLAQLDFDGVAATPIGKQGTGWKVLSAVLDLAAVALAAEQVGGAQRCLDMSVEYATDRYQFGRPIGSFQAIAHKCADMLLEVESARSAAYYAASCTSERPEQLPSVAALAKAYCSDAYVHAASENIQIHGGIGFTWEHPAQLYFKRAASSALLFGDATYHRELLAQRIGI